MLVHGTIVFIKLMVNTYGAIVMGNGEYVSLQEKERQNKERIFGILKENPQGMTINQLAETSELARETVSKHLQALGYENEVYNHKFGNVQVIYSNHRAVKDKDTMKLSLGNRTIFMDRLENEFGEFVKISETRKTGENWEKKGSILMPYDNLKEFIEKLKEIKDRKIEN